MQMKWLSDVEDLYRKGEQRERERASRGVIGCDFGRKKLTGRAGERVRFLIKERERSGGKEERDGVKTPLIGSAPEASMSRILILFLSQLVSTEHLHYASIIKRRVAAESPERRQLP